MNAGVATVRAPARRDRADSSAGQGFVRRARPLLGTLVEVGARCSRGADVERAIGAGFARIAEVEARLSRFIATSDVGRFNAAPSKSRIAIGSDALRVLATARRLCIATAGAFDVSLGSGADAWRLGPHCLHKLSAGVHLDLGGIGKGYAVDCAIDALIEAKADAGWVNAGGDLRAFGALALPIDLRDETAGGVRRFATLVDGAFATSRLTADPRGRPRHASVAAPRCVWADALTKIVVASGDAAHPLLARFGACAWLHPTGAAPELPG